MIEWPSIEEVAEALDDLRPDRPTRRDDDGYIEVRLQVSEEEGWELYCGSTQHDEDHGGFWGYDAINYKSDMMEVAEGMIEEARDQAYVHGAV